MDKNKELGNIFIVFHLCLCVDSQIVFARVVVCVL